MTSRSGLGSALGFLEASALLAKSTITMPAFWLLLMMLFSMMTSSAAMINIPVSVGIPETSDPGAQKFL